MHIVHLEYFQPVWIYMHSSYIILRCKNHALVVELIPWNLKVFCRKSHAWNKFIIFPLFKTKTYCSLYFTCFFFFGMLFRRHWWLQCRSRRNPSSASTAYFKLWSWNLPKFFTTFQSLSIPYAVRWTCTPSETKPSTGKNSWTTCFHTQCVLHSSTASIATIQSGSCLSQW